MYTETDNYYGFFNEVSDKYLGYNSYGDVYASAGTMLN